MATFLQQFTTINTDQLYSIILTRQALFINQYNEIRHDALDEFSQMVYHPFHDNCEVIEQR